MKNLLLLSNSTNHGEPYLQWSAPHIARVLKGCSNPVFVPFAAVTLSYDDYTDALNKGLSPFGIAVKSLHDAEDKQQTLRDADAILVGGGNTFALLDSIYKLGLRDIIREKVNQGTPYVGWSAGSNLTCPTIKTTNDMPVVEPESFTALDLFPAQINPHYTDKTIEGHGGESRDMRLAEFMEINREMTVLGLPEGCYIEVRGNEVLFEGSSELKVMKYGSEKKAIQPGIEISDNL